MSRKSVLLALGISIGLAAGAAPMAARAQSAQAKTHIGGKPSTLVSLSANLAPGDFETVTVVTPAGDTGVPFALASGSVLVVTDLYVEGSSTLGPYFVSACTSICADAVIRVALDTNQERSRSVTLTSGVVFREPPMVSCAPASVGDCTVRLYGYLAKDK